MHTCIYQFTVRDIADARLKRSNVTKLTINELNWKIQNSKSTTQNGLEPWTFFFPQIAETETYGCVDAQDRIISVESYYERYQSALQLLLLLFTTDTEPFQPNFMVSFYFCVSVLFCVAARPSRLHPTMDFEFTSSRPFCSALHHKSILHRVHALLRFMFSFTVCAHHFS